MELMRGLAFIALLFAGSAVGAELRQAEVCGDGTTHQAGYCPAVLSSASCSATGATTGSCSATSDEADGTRYVCATSSNTALTGAEIEACSGGAAVAGSSAAETGSNSVLLSGLTTDAAHYGQIVNESPEGWYSNRLVSSSFTPTSDGALYDLGSVQFAYSWPTQPTITNTVNVSNASELSAALLSSGNRIVVAAGTYDGTFTVGQNDTWIDMQPGAVIGPSGAGPSLYFNASRMKVTGGTLNGGWWGNSGWSDLIIDGTDFVDQNLNGDNINIRAGQRMAILNLSIDLRFFAFMTLDSSGTTFIDDLIMANVEIEAGATGDRRAPLRLNGVRRGVFRDMRVVSNTSYHMLRLESFNSYHDWKNIQFEGTGTQGINFSTAIPEGGSGTISNIWFENVNVYANSAQFRHFPDSSLISNVTMLNNTWYTNGKTPNDPWVPAPDDFVVPSGSTYTNTTYQPYTSPPAWP